MTKQIRLGKIYVAVIQKNIKNIHLSVYPPDGKVRIAAPLRMNPDTIRVFAISKLGWIQEQQRKLRAQERETPREYISRESHYVWGERHLMRVDGTEGAAWVEAKQGKLFLHARPELPTRKRAEIVEAWYRDELKQALPKLIAKWETRLSVTVKRFFVQRMKTKWGSCSRATGTIRLNTELAKKPRECLEYIVVHEMIHLHEPRHNDRFVSLMDKALPDWRETRDLLNRLPARHEWWKY